MEIDSPVLRLLGVQTYSNLHIWSVHFFPISVVAIIWNLMILVLMHWTKVAWRAFLVKNKDISKKRKLMKNQFDPTKSVHFIKRNNTLFYKHFPHKTCFALVLQAKFFKKLLQIFYKKLLFFCFMLIVSFYKVKNEPS